MKAPAVALFAALLAMPLCPAEKDPSARDLSFPYLLKANPCPCGFYGDSKRQCRCSVWQIENYRQKISGQLLDHLDIHVEVPQVDFRELTRT